MNRLAGISAVICACAHASAMAQVLAPAGTVRPSAVPAAPFSICSNLDAVSASQATFCGLVKMVGQPRYVEETVTWQDGKQTSEQFLEFDVELPADSDRKRRPLFRCVSFRPSITEVDGKVDRYLLIGIRGSTAGRLAIAPRDHTDFDRGFQRESIERGDDSIYVMAFLPTSQTKVVGGMSLAETAFLNIAQTPAKDPVPAVVRQTTDLWSRFSPNVFPFPVAGVAAYQWVREEIGPRLAKIPQRNALEEFRIGGLLASWDRPTRALPYIRSLPRLVKAINLDADRAKAMRLSRDRVAVRRSQETLSDLAFLQKLDLFTGVDPDAVLSVLFSCPELRWFVLDARIGKPSLDYQYKILRMAEDPNPEIRAKALCHFSRWYEEYDKATRASFSTESGIVEVANEESLRSYWRKKIGAPPNP